MVKMLEKKSEGEHRKREELFGNKNTTCCISQSGELSLSWMIGLSNIR